MASSPRNGWKVIPVSKVATQVSRQVRTTPKAEYKMLGVRWYGNGAFLREVVTGDEISASNVYRVEEGDFIYSRLFASKGSFGVIGDELSGCYVSNEFPTFRLDTEVVDPAFLLHLFMQDEMWRRTKVQSRGTTSISRLRLREEDFLKLRIPLPPLPEQRAISNTLGAVDDTIARTQAVIEQLRVAKRAVMRQLLTCGVPGKHNQYQKTHIGQLPVGWEVTTVGKIAKVGNGATPNRSRNVYWDGGTIPWITSGKVHEVFITTADEYITSLAREKCSLRLIPAGSILVAITGQGKTRGTAAMLGIDACINQHIAAITISDHRMHGPFLLAYLSSQYDALRKSSEGAGTTRAALTCAGLAAVHIPVPLLEEQRAISDIGKAYDLRIRAESDYLGQLTEAKRALAQGLLSGEIPVTFVQAESG